MTIWLVEFFGQNDLEGAFLWILLMTAPGWVLMLFLPENRFVKLALQPFIVPPVYCFVLFYILWAAYRASLAPELLEGVSYSHMKKFTSHPVTYLALYCNWQILNLAIGTMIYQKAMRVGLRAPIELILCWALGAPALLVFQLRLLWKRRTLR